ncbi:MAG TPA: GDSL-type esterase/lipase family protein [Candidatus Eisenbacteria bacterium]|nr:GDSL-type esterase/lipase family protein [Candidatus Eisenbacteria bacterium]
MGRLRSLAVHAVLVLVSTGFALGLLEALMRRGSPPPNFFDELEKYMQTVTYAGHSYPVHLANFSGTILGVRFRTNRDGLRDRDFAVPKPPGTLRILALGDSVTLGWGVPEDAMFTKRLEGILSARRGAPVEVVTAAVAGWNTVQELAFLAQQGFGYEPDVVVVGYVVNDSGTPLIAADHRSLRDRLAVTLVTNSRLAELAAVTYAKLTAPTVTPPPPAPPAAGPPPTATPGPVAPAPPARPEPFSDGDRGWLRSRAALQRMATLTRARGISFAVFCFNVYGQAIEEKGCTEVERFVAGIEVPVVSTYHWFDGTDRSRFRLSRTDPHPNAEGNAIIATRLADWLWDTIPALHAPRAP